MKHKKQVPWLLIGLVAAGVCLASLYIIRSRKPSLMDSMQQPATGIELGSNEAMEESMDTQAAEKSEAKPCVMELTDAHCLEYIKNCDKPCVIKFYATWCGACNHLASYYDQVAQEFGDKVDFYALDADKQELVKKAQELELTKEPVQYLPTIVFYQKDKLLEQQTGALPKDALVEKVKNSFAL